MASVQIHDKPYRPDSQDYFLRLQHLRGAVWLDSGATRSYNSRYDILTAWPREQVLANTDSTGRDICEIQHRDGRRELSPLSALQYLELRLSQLEFTATATADCPFVGGAIGYLGYESFHPSFALENRIDLLPSSYFGLYDWALVQDHVAQRSFLCVLGTCPREIIDEIECLLVSAPPPPDTFSCGQLRPDITPEAYTAAVKKIQAYIHAGDCYQVNFTQRFTGDFSGSTSAAYLQLRNALPSPFSAYLNTPAGTILSLSPERFIELDNGRVKTQPIKGTAPRGRSAEEDELLARELQQSEKNRAENVMIVDLLRNDLSKVSQPFTVQVPELFGLQTFANVHHLVSTVTGLLRPGLKALDLLKASFPGGSITGAPKKRAMEIIDELEQHPRGIYCGSIFYISLNGRMDSNIAIRTLLHTDSKIYCWGGGGIVADSDPAMEYQESLHKVGLLLETLHPEQSAK